MRAGALALALVILVAPSASADHHPPGVERARAWLADRISARAFRCADALWDQESSWHVHAGEPGRAYGIPQAYPGRRMARAERPERGKAWDDYRDDALVQVSWGRMYVRARYGSRTRPGFCAALRHQHRERYY